MSGLVLKVAAGERFLVNGALLENGDKPARIRIKDNDARVLRCSDALKPDQVDTPVKQVYFAIQLLITGDLEVDATLPSILTECEKLADVFSTIEPKLIPTLQRMLERGNFYSALCHLRGVIAVEASLLKRLTPDDPTDHAAAA
ncbi:MAG: flagellar biosynthesis repressor FlbT [Hyphomonas sp.]